MAHKSYLIRATPAGAQGVCLFEKHGAVELAGMLNRHYATAEQLDRLFAGSISRLDTDGIAFKNPVVHLTDSVSASMERAADLLFDCVIICVDGKWTAYRSKGGFRGYAAMAQTEVRDPDMGRTTLPPR